MVAIHQPNLFPWLGFFDKMAQVDVFVLLDNVPFSKGGYQNRVQVKGSSGPVWLTVPVITKRRLGQNTMDVQINSTVGWQRMHLATLTAAYGRAPGFGKLMTRLQHVYSGSFIRLVDFTIPGILCLKELLGITTTIVLASELGVSGSGSSLLCEMVRRVGGTAYLSGPSGRNYLDISPFEQQGVEVAYHAFEPFEYPQRFGSFVPGLSALDYLANDPDTALWRARRAQPLAGPK